MEQPREIADIDRNQEFQQRMWWTARVGWVTMAVVVLAGLLGVFGGAGPLATGRHVEAGVVVEWPRMARLGLTEPIRLHLPAGSAGPRLPPDFGAIWRLHDTTPPNLLEVEAPAASRLSARSPVTVTLHIEPIGWPGARRLRLDAGGRELDLPVFVWP